MALLFMDGFDHYGINDFLRKWSGYSGSTMSISTTLGRRGGGCLVGPSSAYKNFEALYGTLIVGFAVRHSTFSSSAVDYSLMYLGSGASQYVKTLTSTAGEIYVINDSGAVIGRTRPNVLSALTFAYVEIKVVAGVSTGAVEIRVNGKVELSITNVRTSSNSFASFGFGASLVGIINDGAMRLDDLYVVDTSGGVNNDFLGDCRVDAYMPTSEGSLQQWTPVPAGVHYTTVDENPNNDSDYVETATSGNVELFGYTDLANVPLAIFGVQLNTAIRKTDAGARNFNGAAKVGGTTYFGPNIPINDSVIYRPTIWDKNPATSAAWTRTEIDNAEFGVKLV